VRAFSEHPFSRVQRHLAGVLAPVSVPRAHLRAPSGPAHPGATASAGCAGSLAGGSCHALQWRFAALAGASGFFNSVKPRLGPWRGAGDPGPGLNWSPDPFGVVRGCPVDSEKAGAFSS
jgi:hypothetical protein